MIDAEWDDLADSANRLLERHPDAPPHFWTALACILLMEVHDRIVQLEIRDDDEDGESWKGRR